MPFTFDTANVVGGLVLAVLGYIGGVLNERRQYRLSASAFASDYLRDLRSWASEAIDVLSESAYHARGRSDHADMDPAVCRNCRYRLSALIDRGRFFIPNYNPDDVGANKAAAYRGLRHPALDLLVAAEQVLSGSTPDAVDTFASQRAALVEIKREFVSHVQEILDPRTQNREIAALLRETRGDPSDKRTALERLSQRDHPDFSAE
jgi:hypothetical protein